MSALPPVLGEQSSKWESLSRSISAANLTPSHLTKQREDAIVAWYFEVCILKFKLNNSAVRVSVADHTSRLFPLVPLALDKEVSLIRRSAESVRQQLLQI